MQVAIGRENTVRYKGRSLEVIVKSKDAVRNVLTAWYRERARLKFAEIAEPLIERFKAHGVEPAGIYLQEMPTRWGSCTAKGKIILNPELIKAPRPCIEYVIVHELCHLVHHNHTQKFIDLQTREMPDWEKRKERLELLLA